MKQYSRIVALVVTGVAMVSASPAVASPFAWHVAGKIDGASLTGLACPSASLCVAVDSVGAVLESTSPSVARSWHSYFIDALRAFSGISCPSSSLCVAVDRAGNIVTSTDPADGASAWRTTPIGPAQPFAGVSCASSTLCAAIGSSVVVSSDPTGGPGAWSDTGVGRGTYYETAHDFGPPGDAPPTGISCVDAPVMCVVVNDAGDSLSSQNPTGGPSTWTAGPNSGEDLAVACAPGGLCVTTCPGGVVAGSGNCPGNLYEHGTIVTWTPLRPHSLPTGASVAPDNLTQIWCQSGTQCFATDGTASPGLFSENGPGDGHLYVSTDPTGGASTWRIAYTDPAGLTGLSCPNATCIALDRVGRLLVGYRPPTRAEIRQAAQVILGRVQADIGGLLGGHAQSIQFNAIATGLVTITLRVRAGASRRVLLVAKAVADITKPGASRVRITISRRGRKLLVAVPRRAKIIATVSIARPGGSTVVAGRTFSN